MYPIPGHAALSLAGSYCTRLPYIPAVAATFTVDLIDKFMSDVFHLAPYGRCWFHTLLSVALCSWFVWKWMGREWGLSWALGHFLHLIGDCGFVPWFYPFISYHWPSAPNVVEASLQGVKEAVTVIPWQWDELGQFHFTGWHFSAAVLQVFKGKLLLLELGMLTSIAVLIYYKDQKDQNKRIRIGLMILFITFWAWGTLYQFPNAIMFISSYTGNWILIR